MVKLAAALTAVLATTASALAPAAKNQAFRGDVSLEMANGSKRKAAVKVLKKAAGAVGTVALATAAVPPAAFAAKKAAEVVETVDNTKTIITAGAAAVAAGGAFVALNGGAEKQNF